MINHSIQSCKKKIVEHHDLSCFIVDLTDLCFLEELNQKVFWDGLLVLDVLFFKK